MSLFLKKMAKQFANSLDPDQTPPFVASDLGLHCLPGSLLMGWRGGMRGGSSLD